jgi:hypothetical protein
MMQRAYDYCIVRTTITIDEEILEQLKARAATEGTTVSR